MDVLFVLVGCGREIDRGGRPRESEVEANRRARRCCVPTSQQLLRLPLNSRLRDRLRHAVRARRRLAAAAPRQPLRRKNAHSVGRHARHRRCEALPRRHHERRGLERRSSSDDRTSPRRHRGVRPGQAGGCHAARRAAARAAAARRRRRAVDLARRDAGARARGPPNFCRRPLLPQQAVVERGGGGRSHRAVVAAAAGHAGDLAARGAPPRAADSAGAGRARARSARDGH